MDSKENIRSQIYNALILVKENQWEDAHSIAQSREGHPDYDRLHAFLHRMEGDDFNARYWYRLIALPYPSIGLAEEMEELMNLYAEDKK